MIGLSSRGESGPTALDMYLAGDVQDLWLHADGAIPPGCHERVEERYLVLGTSSPGRLLIVSHTERPPRTRIIGARPATRNERINYEQGN